MLTEETDEEKTEGKEGEKGFEALARTVKDVLGDQVSKVVISHRLVDVPAAIRIGQFGCSASVECIIKAQALRDTTMSSYISANQTFEISSGSSVIKALKNKAAEEGTSQAVSDIILLLYDTAMLSSGFTPRDPNSFAKRINALVCIGLGATEEVLVSSIATKNTVDAAVNGDTRALWASISTRLNNAYNTGQKAVTQYKILQKRIEGDLLLNRRNPGLSMLLSDLRERVRRARGYMDRVQNVVQRLMEGILEKEVEGEAGAVGDRWPDDQEGLPGIPELVHEIVRLHAEDEEIRLRLKNARNRHHWAFREEERSREEIKVLKGKVNVLHEEVKALRGSVAATESTTDRGWDGGEWNNMILRLGMGS